MHFGDTPNIYISYGPGHKIHFGHPQSKICKIHFGHLIVLISPNTHHTNYYTNRKWIHLNSTPSRILSITEPASPEARLKDIKKYLTVYVGKATLFQNPNKNLREDQSRPIQFTILIRRSNIH